MQSIYLGLIDVKWKIQRKIRANCRDIKKQVLYAERFRFDFKFFFDSLSRIALFVISAFFFIVDCK